MTTKTKLALVSAGMLLAASGNPMENVSIAQTTKKEHKSWFIKNKTNEYVKAGHSRAFARILARLAYQNSLRK